jgi:hypothetical protein
MKRFHPKLKIKKHELRQGLRQPSRVISIFRGRDHALWRQFETPEGLLLYDRGTGLNILFESFKKHDQNFFDRPLYAQVKVTNRCNLHCSFCSQRSGESFEDQWTFGELFSLFKYLDEYRLMGIAIGDGEPFAYPRLAELVNKTWNETGTRCLDNQ